MKIIAQVQSCLFVGIQDVFSLTKLNKYKPKTVKEMYGV